MPRFANSYWSPDYRTSIEKLGAQLLLSLSQLHELRKLVFNHIKYHHANGEFLADVASKSFPTGSAFRTHTRSRVSSGMRKVSAPPAPEVDMKYVFHQYVERTSKELYAQQALASEIDRAVLDKITASLKNYEPQINATLDRFEELFLEYGAAYDKIEALKESYDSHLRFAEFRALEGKNDLNPGAIEPVGSEPDSNLASSTLAVEKTRDNVPAPHEQSETTEKQDFGFVFPLDIAGVLEFNALEDFAEFLTNLTDSIETTKRKIPIPGHTNELFSSNQICEHFSRSRPHGFNPTRSNLEKLGQSLINLRIIVNTGFFAKKFTSEGMWFEWSDKVMQIVHGETSAEENSASLSRVSSQSSKMRIDDTHKFMNDVAASTSKTFNGMFKSVKTSLLKPKFTEEGIKQVEADYNDAYEDLQKIKHLLEMEIFEKSQFFERFEMLKVEVIYQSLTKLLEIVYKHSLQSTTSLHEFTLRFIEQYNKPENYKRDYTNTVENFSTGIYFPSYIAPDYLAREHASVSQLNTNFQNIKLGFNLYKDIPLQLKVGDFVPSIPNQDLDVRSLPVFLFSLINILKDQENTQTYWLEPIKHQDYWLIKAEIVSAIQEFVPDDSINVHDHNVVESAIFQRIISILGQKEIQRVVNFVKNWLLEISDSVMPSTVYDSLIGVYTEKDKSSSDRIQHAVRILKSIPRSNLSSLIFLLGHITQVFFESPSEPQEPSATNDTEEIATKLNQMDAIGAVPFLHLILRPSVVKNASGLKPPAIKYNALLADLLKRDTQTQLRACLIDSEQKFLEKQEQQTKLLGITKKHVQQPLKTQTKGEESQPQVEVTPDTPTTPTRIAPLASRIKSPALGGDNFSLRPFRTGTTPRPSPTSSPVHQKRQSEDFNHLPRSSSANFLAPTIDIQFEG